MEQLDWRPETDWRDDVLTILVEGFLATTDDPGPFLKWLTTEALQGNVLDIGDPDPRVHRHPRARAWLRERLAEWIKRYG